MFTGSDGGAGFDAVSRSVRAFIPSSYKSMNSLAFLLAVPADTPALLQAKSDPPNPHKKAQKYLQTLQKRMTKAKALSVLAHKLGRCVYFMMKHEKVFDESQFLKS